MVFIDINHPGDQAHHLDKLLQYLYKFDLLFELAELCLHRYKIALG